ncbi:hypothetical protein BH24BAC1_BH24BAC1_17510 [soil metagenome]
MPLEDAERKTERFSYASPLQTDDGLLHLTYSSHRGKGNNSIKYVVLNPQRVTQ